MKRIQCINEDGMSVEFNYKEDGLFFLVSLEGVYSFENEVKMSDYQMTDGALYQSSLTRKRNIIITAEVDNDYRDRRKLLYKVFQKGHKGIFRHIEDGEIKDIEYITESVRMADQGVIRTVTISLLCADPHFKDPFDTTVSMAGWENLFEWPHEFVNPEELTRRKLQLIKGIENEGTVEETGMEIILKANASVKNPIINHVEDGTFMKIYKQMQPGDVIKIVTKFNEKNVYFTESAGQTKKANFYLDEDSTFIQLKPGTNTIQYDADVGAEYLDVDIIYRTLYTGV